MGIFHKEYSSGEYVCDYVLAHHMEDFLNLVFNFSKFIYTYDLKTHQVEFLFDLQFVK